LSDFESLCTAPSGNEREIRKRGRILAGLSRQKRIGGKHSLLLQEFNYKLPALRDPEHALVKKSGAKVTPEAAVFNSKRDLVYHGRIDDLYREFGKARRAATTHELADAIEAASKGAAPRQPLRRALAASFPTSNDADCASAWRGRALLCSGNCSGLAESFDSQTTEPKPRSESASDFQP